MVKLTRLEKRVCNKAAKLDRLGYRKTANTLRLGLIIAAGDPGKVNALLEQAKELIARAKKQRREARCRRVDLPGPSSVD